MSEYSFIVAHLWHNLFFCVYNFFNAYIYICCVVFILDTPIKGASNREDVGREAFAWNSLPVMESEDTWPDWDTEFEDYSGISGPLYEVVDAVLALPAQKFFRRQVIVASKAPFCISVVVISFKPLLPCLP